MSLRDYFSAMSAAFPGMVYGTWAGIGEHDCTLIRITVSDGRFTKIITDANLADAAKLLA